MDIIKILIEFFLTHGANSLVFTALFTFVYIVYRISRLNSIEEYESVKYMILWLVIAVPQIGGVIVADKYKGHLPIHSIELTIGSCERFMKERVVKDQKCKIYGRVLDDQNNIYLFETDNQTVKIHHCEAITITLREFDKYRELFIHFYDNTSLYEVIFS